MGLHSISPVIGPDVETAYTSLPFGLPLGFCLQVVNTTTGIVSLYELIEADAALDQYAICAVEEDFGAAELTTTISGAEPNHLVIPQLALASGEYGFALLKGAGSVLAAANCGADAKLYTTATAGVVDDESSGTDLIQGLRLTAANGGAQAAVACFATMPMVVNAQD